MRQHSAKINYNENVLLARSLPSANAYHRHNGFVFNLNQTTCFLIHTYKS